MADADEPGMARQTDGLFLGAVVAAVLVAAFVGVVTQPPAPPYALDSPLVDRLEVATAFFVTLYSLVVLIRLAARGLTPSRVGTGVVQLPQLTDTVGTVGDSFDNEETAIDDMLGALRRQSARIGDLERLVRENDGRQAKSHETSSV
jgi:hypothetical protein